MKILAILAVISLLSVGGRSADYTVFTIAGKAGEQGALDGPGATARFKMGTDVYARSQLTVDASGILYLAESGNAIVRKITIDGTNCSVVTIAGKAGITGSQDGVGGEARFSILTGIACDHKGNLFVTDFNATVRKITPTAGSWTVTTIGGKLDTHEHADGPGDQARFVGPAGIIVDPATGALYLSDVGDGTIRKMTPQGDIWVVSTIAGQSAAGEGHVDGNGTEAQFAAPGGLAMDGAGNILVADADNMSIRKLTPSAGGSIWEVSTVSWGMGDYFESLSCDSSGTIYVPGLLNGGISKVTPDGSTVTVLAGGTTKGSADGVGSEAQFDEPSSVALSSSNGRFFVVDSKNDTIRLVYAPSIPPIQLTSPSYKAGVFSFRVTGTRAVIIEGSSDLVNWSPVVTNSLDTFSEPEPYNGSQRFFRAKVQ